MGVSPVSSIYKTLTFGGNNSGDYGVYITGSGVFNSPERDGEMLVIPGRNGAFWQDNGRFQNIEVTYPAGCFGNTAADFAEAVSDFRNMLCSQNGYVRLTDDYHPDEYRMAVYKSGLEVTPATLNAGEFNITFECKPQRFLTSGEQSLPMPSTLAMLPNPTRFEAKPLVKLYGTGEFTLNGETITVADAPIYGRVQLNLRQRPGTLNEGIAEIVNSNVYQTGDELSLETIDGRYFIRTTFTAPDSSTAFIRTCTDGVRAEVERQGVPQLVIRASLNKSEMYADDSTRTHTESYTGLFHVAGQSTGSMFTCTISITYEGASKRFVIRTAFDGLPTGVSPVSSFDWPYIQAFADSSVPVGSNLTYVDLETGEAYEIVSDEIVPVTGSVTLPAQLPVLKPGENLLRNNGFTKVEIVPRWWQV